MKADDDNLEPEGLSPKDLGNFSAISREPCALAEVAATAGCQKVPWRGNSPAFCFKSKAPNQA